MKSASRTARSSVARRRGQRAVTSLLALVCALAQLGCLTTTLGPPPASPHYRDSTAAAAALDQARAHIAAGAYAASLPALRQVIGACPDHVRTHLLYQDIAACVGGDALAEMRSFYESSAASTSPVLLFARSRLAEDDYTRLQLLDAALERDRSFYWAHLSRARLMRSQSRAAQALASLDDALSARPTFPEARLERAEVLADLGRHEEAAVEYANYVRARPTDRAVLEQYVRLLIYQLGRLGHALPFVERMYVDDPGNVGAQMDLAAIHWMANRPEEAVRVYQNVLRIDPTESRAVLNLGNIYYEPLARGSEETRRAAWAKARKAYLYYLNMSRTEGLFDFADYHLAVPYRLKEIAALLGPDDGRPPAPGDF